MKPLLDLWRKLIGAAWRRPTARRRQRALERDDADVGVEASFSDAAYKRELDRMIELAADCGRREERARIAAIARLPKAERFPRLALNLALSGSFSAEQAAAALADAELELRAGSQPTESTAAENEGRVLH